MSPFVLGVIALTVVWMVAGFELTAILLVALAIVMAVVAATKPGAPIVRYPKRPKQSRWGWSIGAGITPHGPFPFVTFWRRRKR